MIETKPSEAAGKRYRARCTSDEIHIRVPLMIARAKGPLACFVARLTL